MKKVNSEVLIVFMERITIEEARKLFLNHPARLISQEQSYIFYDNFSGAINVIPYLTCGCLVVKVDSDWFIHVLSKEADILLAIKNVKKIREYESEEIIVLTWTNIPEEICNTVRAYKFARWYVPYSDKAIRPLTMADSEAIKQCSALDPEDNKIGKNIAEDFFNNYRFYLDSPDNINLGLFESDSLVGLVVATVYKELGIAPISIFVNRAYRNKGYAKRLLSALCATSKDVMYCYSCVTTNIASINTAKASGFEFKGALLSIR